MKNLGEVKKILGMEITQGRGSGRIWLSQGEQHSQNVRKIQDGRSKTDHYSFDRSLQVILQVVSTITRSGGGDISSTIC